MSRMLVTGASGFVGGAVARAAVAAGWEVVTTSRRAAHVAGAQHLVWDLDEGPLGAAARERLGAVDVVVHAAAHVGEAGRPAGVRRTTVGGTRAVLETVPGARLVHLSTASVYDPFRPSVGAREAEAPVTRYLSPYAAAKADAERLVLAEATRRDVVVLRPHAVYGPGDTTLLPRVLGAVRAGRLLLPGGGEVRQALTGIDTLVRAVLAAATVPLDPGDGGSLVVNVADAQPVVLREVLVELMRQRGLDVRVVAVPARPAWALAGALDSADRVLDGRLPSRRLTRYALSHLIHERTYDLTLLRDRLGVEPGTTSMDGAASW